MHCILAFLSRLVFSPSVHDVCNKQMVGGLCVDGIQSLEAKKVYALDGVSTATNKSLKYVCSSTVKPRFKRKIRQPEFVS